MTTRRGGWRKVPCDCEHRPQPGEGVYLRRLERAVRAASKRGEPIEVWTAGQWVELTPLPDSTRREGGGDG